MMYGEFKSQFIITVGNVSETLATVMINEVGGEICRRDNSLCDIQFKNHKMRLYDSYVMIRNPATKKHFNLYFIEFSGIDIR